MKSFFCLLFSVFTVASYAQTCTGSFGDPIVNITFGAGSSFGSPLPAGTTSSLSYQADQCPSDGNYAILNYTSGCWASDVVWHTVTDHTGNGSGYYMLINASYQPSDFYIQTVTGLCAGTTYQFAAWMINMCSVTGTLPNITMTIEKTDGTILATYQADNIPIINPATWIQYGFAFTTPADVSTVVLRMKNNAPGGVGNDVGLDDITFRPTGPLISISASGFAGDSATLCEGDATNITLVSSVEACYLTTSYQWQVSTDKGINWKDLGGATGSTYTRTPTAAGIYWYRLAVADQSNIGTVTCRAASQPFRLVVNATDQRSIVISKPDGALCDGKSVTFTASTTNGGLNPFFKWQMNGIASGSNSDTFTANTLTTGDVVNCIFTSSLSCNSPATSNSIVVSIGSKTSSVISKTICEGENYSNHIQSGTYIDTLVGSNGCDSIRTLYLTVNAKQQTTLDTTICFGNSYQSHSISGSYISTFTGANGCDSIFTLNLTILPDINRKIWNDTLLCIGDSILLSPGSFDNYRWQDGSANSQFVVRHGGRYSVTVTNQCGTAIKEINITEQICNLAFPSAFTPNGDGLNEEFKAVNAYNLQSFKLLIYNRWGQQIFETALPKKGWNGAINGKPADAGVYVWMCEYKKGNSAGLVKLKGVVTLMK